MFEHASSESDKNREMEKVSTRRTKWRAKRRESIVEIEQGIFRVRQVGWRAKDRERLVGV